MPRITQTDTWVSEYRNLLKEGFDPGAMWHVGENKGYIRLEVKDNGKKQTRVLPFNWSKKGFFSAIPEIQQIYKRFYTGKTRSLKAACEEVSASSTNNELDLNAVIEDFRKFCLNVSDKTWNKSYVPVLHKAQELLERSKGKPIDGRELMTYSLEDWEMGSRSRQIARRALQKFLDYAVIRSKLPSQYAPVKIQETLKKKRIGYALTDSQILQLIASEDDKKWQFAFQLLATFGLRPEELRHLVVKDGELWTMYEKSMGGTKGQKTEPRKLAPLYIRDGKGDIDWNLVERIENEEELPPLGQEGKGGEALGTKLRRNPTWKKFKRQAEKLREELVPYAFRHRFAKTAYARSIELGLTTKDICLVMGHTKEVHEANYARFIPDGTYDKFKKKVAV